MMNRMFITGIILAVLPSIRVVSVRAEEPDVQKNAENVTLDRSQCPPELLKIIERTEKDIAEKGGFAIVGRARFDDGTPIKQGDLDFSLRAAPPYGESHNCRGWRDGWFYTTNIMPGPIHKKILDEAEAAGQSRGLRLQAYALHYDPSPEVTFPITQGTIHYLTLTLRKTPENRKITISGSVTDESGVALPGAVVNLSIAATTNWSGDASLRTTAGPDGRFALPPLTPQDYRLDVSQSGFAEARTVVHSDEEPDWERAVRDFILYKKKNVRFDYVYQPDGSRDFTQGDLKTQTFVMDAQKGGGFRFKDGKQANDGIPQDLALYFSRGAFYFRNFFVGHGNGVYDAGEVSFESLREAEEGDELYQPVDENGAIRRDPLIVQLNHVYVVKTYDGCYAKLIVREFVDP